VATHDPMGTGFDFLWLSLAPIDLSHKVNASCILCISIPLATITVTSSAYATQENLEKVGKR
jgi:hypothetical protein